MAKMCDEIGQLGEDALVTLLTRGLGKSASVIAGPGDDCAVLRGGARGRLQLFKTDCIVEGIHYEAAADLAKVGWKAAARAISDIAAMGGTPTHAVVTLVLRSSLSVDEVKRLNGGLRKACRKFSVEIVGGETSSTRPGAPCMISVSMLGTVDKRHCLYRSGAKPGGRIFVTGKLGNSIAGWHLRFVPRVAESQWLVENYRPQAMMDLSDGLAQDLPRLAKASGVGATIVPDALPLRRGATARGALCDGEDYELLFCVAASKAKPLAEAWRKRFPRLGLSEIGSIVKGKTIDWGGAVDGPGGWDHFRG